MNSQIKELMKTLDKVDSSKRIELLSNVDVQRDELLNILSDHMNNSNTKDVQAAAMYLIGRYRLSKGAQELINWIDFAHPVQSDSRSLALWEKYPAFEALINIGKPSIPQVIKLLATDSSDIKRDLAVKVIKYVEDNEIAVFILQRAFDKEINESRKLKFKDALNRLNKLIEDTK